MMNKEEMNKAELNEELMEQVNGGGLSLRNNLGAPVALPEDLEERLLILSGNPKKDAPSNDRGPLL